MCKVTAVSELNSNQSRVARPPPPLNFFKTHPFPFLHCANAKIEARRGLASRDSIPTGTARTSATGICVCIGLKLVGLGYSTECCQISSATFQLLQGMNNCNIAMCSVNNCVTIQTHACTFGNRTTCASALLIDITELQLTCVCVCHLWMRATLLLSNWCHSNTALMPTATHTNSTYQFQGLWVVCGV